MQLTYYSRSVYVISDAFGVVHDPVVLSLLSLLFSKKSLKDLGFYLEYGQSNPVDSRAERQLKLQPVVGGGDNFELVPDQLLTRGRCIRKRAGLMGAATGTGRGFRCSGCS